MTTSRRNGSVTPDTYNGGMTSTEAENPNLPTITGYDSEGEPFFSDEGGLDAKYAGLLARMKSLGGSDHLEFDLVACSLLNPLGLLGFADEALELLTAMVEREHRREAAFAAAGGVR